MIKKIISGAQTGADRGALLAALKNNIEVGGWVPKGRRAEDGYVSSDFPVLETPSRDYPQRTEWNVRDSDGTIVFNKAKNSRGCNLTIAMASRYKKPILVIKTQRSDEEVVASIVSFVNRYNLVTLNVAGNRESSVPGLQEYVERIMSAVISVDRDF